MPLRLQGRVDRLWRLFAIAIVLVIVILFYVDWRAVKRDNQQLDAARDLQEQTDRLISTVTDAEATARGYLLTGNPVYLSSYNDDAKQIPTLLNALNASIATDVHKARGKAHVSAEVKEIAQIRQLTTSRMQEIQKSVEVRDEEGSDAALAIVKTDEGRITMNDLRSSAKVLVSGEFFGVYEARKASENDADSSQVVVIIGSAGLIFLLFQMGWAVDSVVNEREDLAIKIEEARHLLETTLASIGDAVVVTNPAGEIRFINPVAEKLTGWRLELARHQQLNEILNLVDENTGKSIEKPFELLQTRDHAPVSPHLELISRDGIRRPIEDSSSPIRDSAGKILGSVIVFRDVTGRRAAERDLKRWKETFASAGFGVFLADSKTGEIVDMNPTFASMHGYSVPELLGVELQALVTKDSVAKLTESLDVAVKKGRSTFEVSHLRHDGSTFPGFADVSSFRLGNTGYLAGYCSDITERKRLEDAIKESEERFRTLASALPQMVWSTDALGNLEYVNQGWIVYASWTSGDEARKYLPLRPWEDLLHPEDRENYFAAWATSLQTGSIFETQVRLRRASDSQYRWFLCRAVAARDRGGDVVRWLGGCTDIQQQMEDAARLKMAIQALQRSNSDLEQFAYAASHDLQEPLRMVSIYSQLLQEEYSGQLDEQASSYIEFAVNGAQRMSNLLKALLSFSRVANAAPPASLNTDSKSALDAALANLSSAIQETGARVDCGKLPAVLISEVYLSQLFQNLIGNALKYRQEGPDAPAPHISVEATPEENGKWRFSVRDNGMGIEPEYLTQIFGIFKRLHGSSIDGTGIGLALCQKIVERAGGRIWAESELGKGSTFFFTLQGVETGDHALAYHNFAGRG